MKLHQASVAITAFALMAAVILYSESFGQTEGTESITGSKCLSSAVCGSCIAGVSNRMRELNPNGTINNFGRFGYYCIVTRSLNDRVIQACVVREDTVSETCTATQLDPPIVLDNCGPPKTWYCNFIPEEEFSNQCDVSECACEGAPDAQDTQPPRQTHTCVSQS